MESIKEVGCLVKELLSVFETRFNKKAEIASCAPGRVNLIGEHTDYNDGFVFPMALPLVTVVVGCKSVDSHYCTVHSTASNVSDNPTVKFPLPSETVPLTPGQPAWANYVKGVVANYHGPLTGFEAVIGTTVPLGGGLSSSAAIEVAMYTFLEALCPTDPPVGYRQKALNCQKAEHVFANMPCGIMDQFIAVRGTQGHALLIDCRTQDDTLVRMDNPDIVILVTNSNVKHELTGSEYPQRRDNCHEAARIMGKPSLRDANMDDLTGHQDKMADVLFRRARHVISEIQRTTDAVHSLQEGKFETFGQLMLASHISLRDDFEVSCSELDELVELAMQCDGVYGSRMTGGGFGGCTVTLLNRNVIESTVNHIKSKYTGTATFYVTQACDGARVLDLPNQKI